METASMPGFVKTIFWIIAIYYIFKFLARLFLPVVAKKVVEAIPEVVAKKVSKPRKKKAVPAPAPEPAPVETPVEATETPAAAESTDAPASE